MGFSRQEYWNGLPFPSPGDLPDPGIEPRSPALQVDSLLSEPPGKFLLLTVLSPYRSLCPLQYSFFFFFNLATQLVGSHFPDQGLNLGHSSKSPESQPLGHQGIRPLQYSLCTAATQDVFVDRMASIL